MKIRITKGEYAGRILTRYNLSTCEWYVQAWIGKELEEFKLGFDCEWVRK
jgi:hypothetical protein